MQFYHTTYTNKEVNHPQFEVRGDKVYATVHNKEAVGKLSQPWYEIKGNNIHSTAYNPQGHDVRPMFQIAGDQVYTTVHNPHHTNAAVFNIKK